MSSVTHVGQERATTTVLGDRGIAALHARALRELQSYRGDAVATIEQALHHDPDFVMGHLFRAIVLATFAERRFMDEARASVTAAEALARWATPRERCLTVAARRLVDGAWTEASRTFDALLVDDPRDAFTVQAAHLFDFYRGDTLNLRNRVARVLPQWTPDDPGYSYVLGMYAFGLEENNEYGRAEETARRALEIEPDDAWSIHAVVHVMEMEGRVEEGIDFLRSREPTWGPGNSFAFHNYWHLTLYLLAMQRVPEVLALYDALVKPPVPSEAIALQLLDATSLLWRLYLGGVDVGSRAKELSDAWASRLDVERGFYAFNDMHAMMAFTMAGAEKEAARLLDDLRWTAENGAGDNRMMSRDVGLPTSLAVQAFGRGRWEEVIGQLEPVRDVAHRFGGSHAQRDVLTKTLVAAAERAGRTTMARHYTAERAQIRATPSAPPMPTVIDRRVDVGGGVTLEWGERGKGMPVVFLHDLGDTWRSFERVLERLPAGLRGIAASLRGHGSSDRPESGYRIEDLAADVGGLLDALHLSGVTLVGHGVGSLVAEEVANRRGSPVARLVLVGAAETFDVPSLRALAAELASVDDVVPPALAERFQRGRVRHPMPDAFVERAVAEGTKTPARVWRDVLASALAFDPGTRLRTIQVPTWIVAGAEDPIAPPDGQERLRARIPGSRRSVYPEVGHCPHWEAPQRFVAELAAFVAD